MIWHIIGWMVLAWLIAQALWPEIDKWQKRRDAERRDREWQRWLDGPPDREPPRYR